MVVPAGDSGQLLQSNDTAAPSWVTLHTYYADRDGDGLGDKYAAYSSFATTPPAGYVTDSTDCNDHNATNTLAVPTANVVNDRAAATFTANWTAVVNATAYYLDVAADSSFTSFVSGYNNQNVGNVTSVALSGLDGCTDYYYRVRAVTACGTSVSSNVVAAGTYDCMTFNYTGGSQTFIVPAGVTSLSVQLWGARGGNAPYTTGGNGGYVSGILTVTQGDTLTIIAGGHGGDVSYGDGDGGYGGGAIDPNLFGGFAGGGGRSAIQISGSDVVTAGGGGGADGFDFENGGNGGNAGSGSGGGGAYDTGIYTFGGAGGTSYTTDLAFSLSTSTVGANNGDGKVKINW